MPAFKKAAQNRVIPGFGLSMGITVSMLSLVVLIPLFSIVVYLSGCSFSAFWQAVTDAKTVAAYRVSLTCSAAAAAVNAVMGTLLAWVFTRYRFPLRRLLNGMIELPFALPTSVAGISLTAMYSEKGWVGSWLSQFGIKISYTTAGITMAMIFIGMPFVVRSIQPVLEKLNPQYEEAALTMGASRTRIFFKILLPELLPAILTGFGLAFSRGLGEYGSVVFIAGNIPYQTQTVPLLIMNQLEQFNDAGATSIALVMILFAFLLLLGMNFIQARVSRIARG